MDSASMVVQIASLTQRMIELAPHDLSARVEHCPDWCVEDLVHHLADVQWFWAEIVTKRITERSQIDTTRTADAAQKRPSAIDRLRTEKTRLVDALQAANDSESVWTWWPESQNVGFVKRRQMIEAAVHGWDAANAVGASHDIDASVALVGLQEFIEVMQHDLRADHPVPPPVVLAPTGSPWRGALFTDLATAGDPPLELSGSASDLLLTVWGRRTAPDLQLAAAIAALDLS